MKENKIKSIVRDFVNNKASLLKVEAVHLVRRGNDYFMQYMRNGIAGEVPVHATGSATCLAIAVSNSK